MGGQQGTTVDHETELVAPDSADGAPLWVSNCSPKRYCGVDQQSITGLMAAGVVDCFQAIDVTHDDGAVESVNGLSFEDVVEDRVEHVTIGQAGELVAQRHVLDLFPAKCVGQ